MFICFKFCYFQSYECYCIIYTGVNSQSLFQSYKNLWLYFSETSDDNVSIIRDGWSSSRKPHQIHSTQSNPKPKNKEPQWRSSGPRLLPYPQKSGWTAQSTESLISLSPSPTPNSEKRITLTSRSHSQCSTSGIAMSSGMTSPGLVKKHRRVLSAQSVPNPPSAINGTYSRSLDDLSKYEIFRVVSQWHKVKNINIRWCDSIWRKNK